MFEMSPQKNGLTLVTVPMEGRSSVSVGIWVRAGSRFENKKNSGASHFIEHLVFKGTKSKSVKKIKECIEGRGGMLNAFTGEEVTCYYVKILKKHLPIAVDLVTDLVYNPVFDPKDIEMERGVILEEIKMYKDLPHHQVQDELNEIMWKGHALGRPILGTNDTITKMTRKDIIDYKNALYHNSNLVLSISGNITPKESEKIASKFMTNGSKKKKSQFSKFTQNQKKPKSRFIPKEIEQTHLAMGYHSCSRNDESKYPLTVLHVLLGGNMSSRLFDEVREKRGLAYDIRSSLSLYQDTGAFLVSAGVENGKALSALKIIKRELEKVASKKVSKSELRRAKDYYLGQMELMFESTMENMLWHGERLVYSKEIPSLDAIQEKIEAVSEKEIMDLAKKTFRDNNLNISLVGNIQDKERKGIESLFNLN